MHKIVTIDKPIEELLESVPPSTIRSIETTEDFINVMVRGGLAYEVLNDWTVDSWVKTILDRFPGAREDVLAFIARILFHSGDAGSEVIRTLFRAGYCYYFANMLKDAFGGEVFLLKDYGHVVWSPDNGETAYDIEGVFYDYTKEDLVQIGELGSELEGFRHRKPGL